MIMPTKNTIVIESRISPVLTFLAMLQPLMRHLPYLTTGGVSKV
jgi:hypothetical protein